MRPDGLLKRAACTLAVLAGSQLVLIAEADAKAKECASGPVLLHAVISTLYSEDNPGDTDYNFYLRPVTAEEKAKNLFPNFPQKMDLLDVHWKMPSPCRDQWLDMVVFPPIRGVPKDKIPNRWKRWPWNRRGTILLPTDVGSGDLPEAPINPDDYSPECKKCAGPKQTKCEDIAKSQSTASAYAENPCPKLFSCAECIYDMTRLAYPEASKHRGGAVDMLSMFTTKAEIFIRRNKEDNDHNATLTQAFEAMGIREISRINGKDWGPWGKKGEGREYCSEIIYQDGKYSKKHNGYPCGKQVLFYGYVTYDIAHTMRPEIHPVHWMVMEGDSPEKYHVAHFIDGSKEEGSVPDWAFPDWQFNYREGWGKQYMAPTQTFDLMLLQRITTPVGGLRPRCHVLDLFNYEATAQIDRMGRSLDLCPRRTINLNFDNEGGAAFVTTVKTGPRADDFRYQLNARLETPHGVLAENPPVVPLLTSDRCETRVKPGANPQRLRRWYRWSLESDLTDSGSDSMRTTWTKSPDEIRFMPISPGEIPRGKSRFSAWFPATDSRTSGSVKETSSAATATTAVDRASGWRRETNWLKRSASDPTSFPRASSTSSMP